MHQHKSLITNLLMYLAHLYLLLAPAQSAIISGNNIRCDGGDSANNCFGDTLNCNSDQSCTIRCDKNNDRRRQLLDSFIQNYGHYSRHLLWSCGSSSGGCCGTTINCPIGYSCNIDCNYACHGLIVNAQQSSAVTITNCDNCDEMTINCPQNGYKSIDGLCILEIEANINQLTIYAEESFYDFILQQSNCILGNCPDLISSTMHCGDFNNNINHQCTLDINGNMCINSNDICIDYRIPTNSPTIYPTQITLYPSLTPTNNPTNNPTSLIPTNDPTYIPTYIPTHNPTYNPTYTPTKIPSMEPTLEPTVEPTIQPTIKPTTQPTIKPSIFPTLFEHTHKLTVFPTYDNSVNTEEVIESNDVDDEESYGKQTEISSIGLKKITLTLAIIAIIIIIMGCVCCLGIFVYFNTKQKEINKQMFTHMHSLKSIQINNKLYQLSSTSSDLLETQSIYSNEQMMRNMKSTEIQLSAMGVIANDKHQKQIENNENSKKSSTDSNDEQMYEPVAVKKITADLTNNIAVSALLACTESHSLQFSNDSNEQLINNKTCDAASTAENGEDSSSESNNQQIYEGLNVSTSDSFVHNYKIGNTLIHNNHSEQQINPIHEHLQNEFNEQYRISYNSSVTDVTLHTVPENNNINSCKKK
eukprot:335843_1